MPRTNPRSVASNVSRIALTLAALAALGVQGCASLQSMLESAPKPSASIKDIHFTSASLTSIGLVFDVNVSNPYDVPLPLTKLDYSLTGNQSNLLKGAAPLSGTIPARASKAVSLPVDVSIPEAVKFFKGVRPGATLLYNANLNVTVDTPGLGAYPIPLSRNGEVKVPMTIPGL